MSDSFASEGEGAASPNNESEAQREAPAEPMLEPSTEKDPGEEPKAPPEREEEEPSHEAVGIGVLDEHGRLRQVED